MSKKIGQRKKAEKQKLRQKEIRNRDSQLLEQPSCDCQSVQRLPICSRQKCMLKTGTASSSTPECSPPECRWMRRKCLQSLACTCPLMDAVCVECERGDLGITEDQGSEHVGPQSQKRPQTPGAEYTAYRKASDYKLADTDLDSEEENSDDGDEEKESSKEEAGDVKVGKSTG
ncbi:hypothetical protein pipiens_019893 [Culex pipiens pipiens]|uniref:Uncharacterized protein n=1 Tax=Culex pipiens pipiens TaxID=38569 RepID=A0ABD1DQK4_CULPP